MWGAECEEGVLLCMNIYYSESGSYVNIIYSYRCKLLKKSGKVIDWFRYLHYEYFIDEPLQKWKVLNKKQLKTII
jgi:hypothetical protein